MFYRIVRCNFEHQPVVSTYMNYKHYLIFELWCKKFCLSRFKDFQALSVQIRLMPRQLDLVSGIFES